MNETRKTVTVTFGSLSCTIEGFDGGVDALRDIAEVLRDIASSAPNSATSEAASVTRMGSQDSKDASDVSTPDEPESMTHEKPEPLVLITPVSDQNKPIDRTVSTTTSEAFSDQDVARLMAETDSHLDAPEHSRRRNVIEHLKSAAKVKRSESKVPDAETPVGTNENDGTAIVKEQSDNDKNSSAPLFLDESQKVDDSNHTDFRTYARHAGVRSPAEIYHAAAVYLNKVDGRTHFSRREWMHTAEQTEGFDLNLENSLRAVGTLLRSGKVKRGPKGHYTLVADTK